MNLLYLILLLMILGSVFLSIEFFVPGIGIFGIIGSVLLFFTPIVAIFMFTDNLAVVLYGFIFNIVIVYILFRFAKNKQIHKKFILEDTLKYTEGDYTDYKFLIGEKGVAKISLKPYGKVIIKNQIYDALTFGEFIKKDKKIEVVENNKDKLIVREIN